MHATPNIYGDAPSVATLPAPYRPETPEAVARRAEILELVAGETIIAPPALPFLKPVKAVRQLGIPPEELIRRLSETFTKTDLVATGVARPCNDHLRLSRVLGAKDSSFRLRYFENRPVDAVAAGGVLSGARRELARLTRATCDSASMSEQAYLVTDCEQDARLFQQLGLYVTSAAPLRSVTRNTISPFLAVRHPSKQMRRWQLVVPLWRPHELKSSASRSVLEVVQQLDRLSRFNGLDCGAVFRAWCPTPREIRRFREASKLRDGKLLATEFRKSLANSAYAPHDALTVIRDRSTVDFGVASQRLEQIVAGSQLYPLVSDANAALKTLTRAFKHGVLSRLLAAANNSAGGEALAYNMVAQLAWDWFNALDQVAAAVAINDGANPQRINSERLFELRLKVVDAFSKIYRHIPKPR